MKWTDAKVARLRSLYGDKLSFTQIANRMSKDFETKISRGSIASKLWNLGLRRRDK